MLAAQLEVRTRLDLWRERLFWRICPPRSSCLSLVARGLPPEMLSFSPYPTCRPRHLRRRTALPPGRNESCS
eukprot:476490-Amphidinium_carterae.2